MLLFILIGSVYFILLDEFIMGLMQRRIGPFNVGWYGILSSIINGLNLIITQLIIPKLHFYFGFQSFAIFFSWLSLISYNIIHPFYLITIIYSLVLLFIFTALSIYFIILSAFSGNSKYSMLGSIRITSQLISFELIWTTTTLFFIISFYEISISGLTFSYSFIHLLFYLFLIYYS